MVRMDVDPAVVPVPVAVVMGGRVLRSGSAVRWAWLRVTIAVADAKGPSGCIDTHSGCAEGTSNHVLTQVSV